ncbi:reverse transcriptase domain-containing protein [Tanacetum coccineum]|uniref:Reverse transcriptase domain-containing protein n=1 Tax=Tanacetum coccineum TaxID=301880 RepID=A0ABQ5C5M4_9ASTR
MAAGGNIMRKTPQEAYDLIENMTLHHFQWDAEVYYDTTTGVSAHYFETTSALSVEIELIRQNCQFHGFRDEDANEHLNKYLSITQFIKKNGVSEDIINLNLFPFSLTHEAEIWYYHLKTHSIHTWEEMVSKFLSKYYPYSKALHLRKEILNFRQLPAESVFEAWERFKSCLRKCPDHRILLWDAEVYYDTTTGVSAYYSETTSTLSAEIESDEGEPSEVDKSKADPFIRESTDTFFIGDEEIELNSHEDIDDLVPIPRVSEKPLDSRDLISKAFDMTIKNLLFDFDSEFTVNSDNPIFDIQNKESVESKTKTIMEEVRIHSSQSTAQIPPPYPYLLAGFSMIVKTTMLVFNPPTLGGSHLLTHGEGCPMTACHVAATLMCTRLQVAGRLSNQRMPRVHGDKKWQLLNALSEASGKQLMLIIHDSENSILLKATLSLKNVLEVSGRDEKKRLDHLKQDQEMLVIKIFSERKKDFKERKKCEKIRAKRKVVSAMAPPTVSLARGIFGLVAWREWMARAYPLLLKEREALMPLLKDIKVQGLVYLILSNSSNVFSKSKMTKSFSFKPARSVSIRRMFAAIAEMPSGGEESPSSSSRGMRSFWTSEEDLFKFD